MRQICVFTNLILDSAKDLGPEDADPEKKLDADEDLDETLHYSLPYEDNDKDKDNDNIGYRVQWEPLNGSLVETSDSETEEDGGELCTHKFNTDEEPAPFSTSFVKDEEGEEEAPDSLQPVAPDAETQQVTFHLVSIFIILRQVHIHDNLSHVRWAGALMEVRSLFGLNSAVKKTRDGRTN